MEQSNRDRLMELIRLLNRYWEEYHIQKAPTVSDGKYDELFNELIGLQTELGIYMANSPTMRRGKLPEIRTGKIFHPAPVLPVEQIDDISKAVSFQKNKQLMLMLRPEGVTVKLVYENCQLVQAVTCGTDHVGEDFLHHVYSIAGIPILITREERFAVIGTVFIRPADFETIKDTVSDSAGKRYANSQCLAADSLRLTDPEQCRERKLQFRAICVPEGLAEGNHHSQRLAKLPEYGFDVCTYFVANRLLSHKDMERGISRLQAYAKDHDIPYGGILVSYNDAAYGKSCCSMLHYRRKEPMVDPQVLEKYLRFAGEEAMAILDLSEDILEKLIHKGLIQSYADIYRLGGHRDEIVTMEGLSDVLWQRLWAGIQRSRNTTLERFVFAMGIPMIGKTESRILAEHFREDPEAFTDAVDDMFDFRTLLGLGDDQHDSIYRWFWNEENYCMWFELREVLVVQKMVGQAMTIIKKVA